MLLVVAAVCGGVAACVPLPSLCSGKSLAQIPCSVAANWIAHRIIHDIRFDSNQPDIHNNKVIHMVHLDKNHTKTNGFGWAHATWQNIILVLTTYFGGEHGSWCLQLALSKKVPLCLSCSSP